MSHRWSIRRLDRTLGEYAPSWDMLRKRQFKDNPMLDSRFVDALLAHFADGSERLCIYHIGGVPQSMCILRPRGIGIWVSFLPPQAQIGPSLLNRPDLVDALIHALPGVTSAVDFLCNDPDFGDLSEQDNRHRESRDHSLTMNIHLQGGFDSYWAARPKKLIQNIGRYQRRIEADGIAMKIVRVMDAKDIDAAIARYAQLESSGWKGTKGTALVVGDTQYQFYLDLFRRFAKSAEAAVYELWLGDELAASRLIIASGDALAMIKTTYDESKSRYSPGRLLLRAVIKDLFERHPDGGVEFYTDANSDLLAWATEQRWIRHVSFYRGSLTSNLFGILRASRQALKPLASGLDAGGENDNPDRVEVYRHPCEFPQDVQRLFALEESVSIEFGQTWYANLVDTVYSGDAGVRFYVLRLAHQPVAALPVLIDQTWGGKQAKSLTNYYSPLYAPALSPTVKAIELVPLINAIRQSHRPVVSFRFAPMDPESITYRRLLNALRSAGMVPFQFFCFGNWYMKVDCQWADYLAAREGALRSTIRRMSRKLASDGGNMEIIQTTADLERGLAAYKSVYSTSWKTPEPYPEFVPGLIRACAERGWLRLGVAWLKDKPIAAQLWIVANGKASIYKLAYDKAFKGYAPGTLLTAMLTEHVMLQDGVGEIDYLIGDDSYKKTWMNKRRERWGLIAYDARSLHGIVGLAWELTSRFARRLKSR